MANFSHLCMNCFSVLPEGHDENSPCAVCGDVAATPNAAQFLQIGTVLSERYLVGRLQQAAGDAAVYAGFDTVLKAPIVIREFWPQSLCERDGNDALTPAAGCETVVAEYLRRFLAHARVVARMRDLPASIPTYDIFQENNTAYTVSERCEGVTLSAYLEEHGGTLSWDEARPLFIPLAASLITLHKAGVYHLGLTPDNLILAEDGKLHIGDFAIPEARVSDSELSADLTTGYAAPEQYAFGTKCDAATDVYGLAAVIFRTLVGNPPPDGETRPKSNADLTVPSDVTDNLPPHVASALFHALQPVTAQRIRSMDVFRDRLSAAPAVAALLDDEEDHTPVLILDEEEEEPVTKQGNRRALFIVLFIVGFVGVLVALVILALNLLFPGRIGGDKDDTAATTTTVVTGDVIISDTASTYAPNTKLPVPNLVGLSYNSVRGKFVEDRPVLLEGLKYSDTVPAGVVLSQSPEANTEEDISKPVYVIVSAGPENITVPDLTGWQLSHAMEYMKALGMDVQIDELPSSTQAPGCIDSTSPAKGASLVRGGVIRLRVSVSGSGTSTTPTTSQTPPSSTGSSTTSTTTTTTTSTTSTTEAETVVTTTEPVVVTTTETVVTTTAAQE